MKQRRLIHAYYFGYEKLVAIDFTRFLGNNVLRQRGYYRSLNSPSTVRLCRVLNRMIEEGKIETFSLSVPSFGFWAHYTKEIGK